MWSGKEPSDRPEHPVQAAAVSVAVSRAVASAGPEAVIVTWRRGLDRQDSQNQPFEIRQQAVNLDFGMMLQ